ncbi:Holliday junction resolvase RuvX [Verrucomicrobiota bacterium]
MGRVLGVDYGKRRLGFAVGDTLDGIAMPFRVNEVRTEQEAVAAVASAAKETGAELIVVGLPIRTDGTEGPEAAGVGGFAALVAERTGLQVEKWDERLSTRIAERTLIEADVSRRKRKKVVDKLAAQVILQGFMDCQAAGGE